jgi:hypothetical protein
LGEDFVGMCGHNGISGEVIRGAGNMEEECQERKGAKGYADTERVENGEEGQ